ncbi:MAG: class I SAM-dependent methyltransferase [Candidatus Thorarchaeota archaeon]|jgi:cyclopropane fatty-acyl-phospholipid synthase-like methyltransferase
MPEWEDIFEEQGRVFTEPHQDMERVVQIFGEHQVKKVLDVGCGSGRHLVYLSKRGFETYGFDVSQSALSLAHEWLEEEGLQATIIKHQMEQRFPYQDSFFDAVISTQVIHHNRMREILFTVSEIERVLRLGGVIFVSFPIFSEVPSEGKKDWKLEQIEPGTYIPHRGPEAGIPHHYFTEGEIYKVFVNFDIQSIHIDETSHRCVLGIKK